MRIAFLLPADTRSGGTYVVCEHAKELSRLGHEVVLVFRSPCSGDGPTASQSYRLKTMGWAEALTFQFDIGVATWWETVFHLFQLHCTKYAYFVQSDERRFYTDGQSLPRMLAALTYQMNIPMITEARWIQQQFREEFGASLALAPNAISSDVFRSVRPLEEKRNGVLRVLIEGPGRVAFKRVGLSFDVTNAIDGIEVWYVSSDGHTEPNWRADKVLPPQPRSEMSKIYSSCDVLLKLSTVEGFPLPPLEMMACGGTAVVSQVTGIEEYVVDGSNALVVPLDDKDAAVKAVKRFRDDRELLAKLKTGAVQTVKAMSWSDSSKQFEQFLKSVTESSAKADFSFERLLAAYARAVWTVHIALPTVIKRSEIENSFQSALG